MSLSYKAQLMPLQNEEIKDNNTYVVTSCQRFRI